MIPWVHMIFNFCVWMIWMTVFQSLFPRRLPLFATILIEIVLFFPYYFFVENVLTEYSILHLIIGELLVFSIPALLFKGKLYEKALLKIAVFLIALVADMFVYHLGNPAVSPVEFSTAHGYPLWQYGLTFLINLILNALLVFGCLPLKQNQPWAPDLKQILTLTLFAVSQIVMLVHWLNFLWNDPARYAKHHVALPFLFCVIADVLVFFMIYQIVKISEISERVRLLEEENTILGNHYAELAGDYEKIASIRKSLMDQWNRIIEEVQKHPSQETASRIGQLQEVDSDDAFPACRNRIVAAFLQDRKETLERNGIGADFAVSMPGGLAITNTALICVFGNLLDNAAEACEKMDHPRILLKADYASPYLRIRLENPYQEDLIREKRIPELERGVGTLILDRMASEYDGNYHTEEKNGIFIASMMLKGESKNADSSRLRR